jgi:hypothetical protein
MEAIIIPGSQITPESQITPAAIPGTVIQVVAWENILIALTNTGAIWGLRGRGGRDRGTDPITPLWRQLSLDTDPTATPLMW